jgi:hypothetical protein
MLRALSPKEELKHRRESFANLKEGTLFDLAQERFFIAVKKSDPKTWEVIELTKANKKQIISGEACKPSVLRFDEMSCLNLRRS